MTPLNASAVLFLLLLVASVSAAGLTFYVSPFGNDNNDGLSPQSPFRSIKKGVSVANKDTVILMPGAYTGNNNINVTIPTSMSISADIGVTITCSGHPSSFGFIVLSQASHVSFSGFKIIECQYGIKAPYSSNNVLRGIDVENVHFGEIRTAILAQDVNLTVKHSLFTKVEEGIFQNYMSLLTVDNSSFVNVTYNAINIHRSTAKVNISNSHFERANKTAIRTLCGFNIINSTFINNSGNLGGAIFTNVSGNNEISNSIFVNNTANVGAAIYLSLSNLRISNSVIESNMAHTGAGVYFQGQLEVIDSTFVKNMAMKQGGGFYCASTNSFLTNVAMIDNFAPSGSAYYCYNCVNQSKNVTLVRNTAYCPSSPSSFLP